MAKKDTNKCGTSANKHAVDAGGKGVAVVIVLERSHQLDAEARPLVPGEQKDMQLVVQVCKDLKGLENKMCNS